MLILYNANIFTQDAEKPFASALAIQDGMITAVGDIDDLLSIAAIRTEKRDMGGRFIIPGLMDSHIHLELYANFLNQIDCETPSKQACLDKVAEKAKCRKAGEWILGYGWNQNVWEGGFGTKEDLDSVAPNHPVFLYTKSGHAAWANSLALKKAGINAYTPDPPHGIIHRSDSGDPDGILFENAAIQIEKIIPPTTEEALIDALDQAQDHLISMGLTGIHDFDGKRCFSALQTLAARKKLKIRVNKGIPVEDMPYAIGVGLRSGFGGKMMRVGSVKMFADGALGPQTAAMIAPYEDDPENHGILFLTAKEMQENFQEATRNGLSIAIHAIGDKANHEALDAFESLREFERQNGIEHRRHRIEHVQSLDEEDIQRLNRMGIIASMQPIHATSDMIIAEKHWGSKRCDSAYAFRSLLDKKSVLAFGSDAPVESPNPFWGIHAAVTRQRQDGSPSREGWKPAQRLRLTEALHAYTIGSAYAGCMEHRLGKVTTGYYADLVVLEEDIFSIPPEDLFKVTPTATMVGGEWVWRNSKF